jgi:hypothetical protein
MALLALLALVAKLVLLPPVVGVASAALGD